MVLTGMVLHQRTGYKDKTFKLELVEEYNGDALSETKLLEHGFHGGRSLQHPMKNNPELFEYIQKQF